MRAILGHGFIVCAHVTLNRGCRFFAGGTWYFIQIKFMNSKYLMFNSERKFHFHIILFPIFFRLASLMLKLFEIWRFENFFWKEFALYHSDSCQHRTWPYFYNKQASYQILLKLVNNFLSYLDYTQKEKQKDKQKNRKTDSHE